MRRQAKKQGCCAGHADVHASSGVDSSDRVVQAGAAGAPSLAQAKQGEKMSFSVKEASWSADQTALSAVRRRVFIEEQGIPAELEWDVRDAQAWHVLAVDAQQQPVGCGRLLETGQIGRMAVLADWRGQGVGAALLQALLAMAQRKGLNPIWLNAQESARGFYRAQDFVEDGDMFMEAGIPHYRMRWR
ncbi:GNAT family N-acetyltransferase [Chitinivorax tropicus]